MKWDSPKNAKWNKKKEKVSEFFDIILNSIDCVYMLESISTAYVLFSLSLIQIIKSWKLDFQQINYSESALSPF